MPSLRASTTSRQYRLSLNLSWWGITSARVTLTGPATAIT